MNDDEIRQDDVEELRRVLQCPQPRRCTSSKPATSSPTRSRCTATPITAAPSGEFYQRFGRVVRLSSFQGPAIMPLPFRTHSGPGTPSSSLAKDATLSRSRSRVRIPPGSPLI